MTKQLFFGSRVDAERALYRVTTQNLVVVKLLVARDEHRSAEKRLGDQ